MGERVLGVTLGTLRLCGPVAFFFIAGFISDDWCYVWSMWQLVTGHQHWAVFPQTLAEAIQEWKDGVKSLLTCMKMQFSINANLFSCSHSRDQLGGAFVLFESILGNHFLFSSQPWLCCACCLSKRLPFGTKPWWWQTKSSLAYLENNWVSITLTNNFGSAVALVGWLWTRIEVSLCAEQSAVFFMFPQVHVLSVFAQIEYSQDGVAQHLWVMHQ